MNEEVKRIDLAWSDKMSYYEDRMYAFQRLWEIEEYIRECDEILGEVGLGIGFVSKANEIELLSEERSVLWSYISRLQSYHEYNIDNPLYKFFVNGATETISKIKLENFEVDNDLGLTVEYYPAMAGYSATIEKDKLTFEDFIGTLDGKADQIGIHTQFANGSIEDFAVIFEQQYQSMLESGMLGENSEMTQEEFLTQFYHQGEFDHKMDKPFASFVSSVLDITIIKPLIEACTGEEWFTGEDLTDMERGLKAVFAMVDLFTLGMAAGSTKITELGAKEALEFTWKTVAVEFGSNVAVCGIGALGEAFDWPVSVTIMLSLATGITVSCIGNKLLFQNGDRVIREKVLDEEQVKKIGESLEGRTRAIKFNEVKTFTAEETNQWFIDNVKPDYKPPYKLGTIVKEIELTENTTFVRVYDNMPDGSGMYGSWVMKAEDIEGLTPLEIQNKFALPNTPKYVCDVELDAGTHIRVGEVNPLDGWGTGGGTQYDLIGQRIGDFKNERLLEGN